MGVLRWMRLIECNIDKFKNVISATDSSSLRQGLVEIRHSFLAGNCASINFEGVLETVKMTACWQDRLWTMPQLKWKGE
jgi:hypothetical protein